MKRVFGSSSSSCSNQCEEDENQMQEEGIERDFSPKSKRTEEEIESNRKQQQLLLSTTTTASSAQQQNELDRAIIEEEWANLQFPDAKRTRIEAPIMTATSLESTVERIGRRLLQCSIDGQEQCLPQTRQELEEFIKPFAHSDVLVDSRVILFHLLVNNILIDIGGCHYIPNTGADIAKLHTNGFIACIGTNEGSVFSSEFVQAFFQSSEWIVNNFQPNSPIPEPELKRRLESVCVVKRDISSGAIIASVVDKGWITFVDDSQQIVYNSRAILHFFSSSTAIAAPLNCKQPHFQGIPIDIVDNVNQHQSTLVSSDDSSMTES